MKLTRSGSLSIPWGVAAAVGLLACTVGVRADTVSISVPSTISFDVTDITKTTTGTPNPFVIAFWNAQLASGDDLVFNVMASAPVLTIAGGTSTIPVGDVNWTITANSGSPQNGTGVLSTSSTTVWTSAAVAANGRGRADLVWTLLPPPPGISAGSYSVTGQWLITEGSN
jgi:hypothetical protein